MTAPSDELVELVSGLVSCETENPPGNEEAAAEFIIDWFAERGIDADRVEKPDPDRPQVGVKVGEGEPRLVLNGHIDVVPAGDLDEWDHAPYGAEREGDDLYGRGSVDMKSGVAIGMLVTAALAEEVQSGELEGSLVFHAAMGEETADPGTKTLLEEGYDGEYGVVLEPTELRTATTEKGLAWYEITVEGEPSHASRPDQGQNAILAAQHVVDALESYDDRIRAREDDLVGQAYATVTMFEAGTKENVLPEEAVITVDRRFLPDEDIQDIDAEIDGLLNGVAAAHDVETEWERTRTYEAAEIPVDSDIAEVFRDHAQAVAGVTRQPFGTTGSTDVRNFINDADMEAITWGPGDTSQAHTYDEHVDLTAVADGREILERAAREILAGQ